MSARAPEEGLTVADLRAQVTQRQWYHTFELAPGLETPGWFDLRQDVRAFPFPESLEGQRCLDIGTFDGFWAFEMERRGGEVQAIDVIDPAQWDWPAGAEAETVAAINERKRGGNGFELVRQVLSSNVERHELSVYDLSPEAFGRFDFVYLGSLLLHLRDPVRALMSARSVCEGTFVLCDAIDLTKTRLFPRDPVASLEGLGRPWWWRPNVAALERMVESAGFERVGETRRVRLTPGRGHVRPPVSPSTLRGRSARQQVFHSRLGDPHAIVRARPA